MVSFNSSVSVEMELGYGTGTYHSLCKSFKSVSQSLGESVYTTRYLGGEGFAVSEVGGFDFSLVLKGDYDSADPVISYLFSPTVLYGTGNRLVKLRITKGSRSAVWKATITKIEELGGEADKPVGVLVEFKGYGKPVSYS